MRKLVIDKVSQNERNLYKKIDRDKDVVCGIVNVVNAMCSYMKTLKLINTYIFI